MSGVRCERCVNRLAVALRGHEGLEAANANLMGQVLLSWDDERDEPRGPRRRDEPCRLPRDRGGLTTRSGARPPGIRGSRNAVPPSVRHCYGSPVSEVAPDNEARRIATRARDRVRFEEEALALADQVYRVARRLVGSREEAEDLVQETYARAFRSWQSYTPGTNLRAWLLRILTNLNIDRGRRQQRAPELTAARGERLLPRQQGRGVGGRAGARSGARRRALVARFDRDRALVAAARLP